MGCRKEKLLRNMFKKMYLSLKGVNILFLSNNFTFQFNREFIIEFIIEFTVKFINFMDEFIIKFVSVCPKTKLMNYF